MRTALPTIFSRADALLRATPYATESGRARHVLPQLLSLLLACGLWYGAVMGTFAGLHPDRLTQILYSSLKVPLLLLLTFAIALPNFFILNTLAGVRDDFVRVLRALMATQAAITLILASLSPMTALWYATCSDYNAAILFNTLAFGTASLAGQSLLRKLYRPLIAKHPAHRPLLRAWVLLYAFVGIQTAWVLRPFIGDPTQPTTFFRPHMWGNAYEVLAQMIWHLLRR